MASNDEQDNAWQFDAACIGKWELFDSVEDEYNKSQYPNEDEALALCHSCPVRSKCYETAVKAGEPQGIWGGAVFPIKKRRSS